MATVDVIKSSYVFRRLNPEQLYRLADIAHEENYRPGQYIFQTGNRARSFYIIEDGKVELQVGINIATSHHVTIMGTPVEECSEKIGVITQGMSLGWSPLVGREFFSGCARAVNKCKLIALDAAKLRELMDSDVALGYEVMKQFAQELAASLDALGELLVSERGLALLREANCC